jgi:DnaJ-domain-containing protein 1
MTGPDRITSILKAYTEYSRTDYKSRGSVGPIEDRVQISSEGLQKSKEFFSKLQQETSPEQSDSSPQQSTPPPDTGSSGQAGYNLEILSLSSSAGMDQIHKAYLAAMKQYHPDKFSSFSPEFKKLAEEKSKQIILAYEKLTKFSDKSL